jgi:hypothetical protein
MKTRAATWAVTTIKAVAARAAKVDPNPANANSFKSFSKTRPHRRVFVLYDDDKTQSKEKYFPALLE